MFLKVNKRRFLERLLPASSCLLCADVTESGYVCRQCQSDLPTVGIACHLCARPLPTPGPCPDCSRRPPPYRAAALFRYEYPLSLLIQRLKFRGQAGIGRTLGLMMLESGLVNTDKRPQCLIPMPLHWRRQFMRGFNQALELAWPIAAGLDLPVNTEACHRIRPSRPQSELGRAARRSNVRGIFAANADQLPDYVAIIDDVITSGHTASELARCLRRAGAKEIEVWALARAGVE